MIFYFSGTGNSMHIAKKLSEIQKDNLISVAQLINEDKKNYTFTLKDDEVVGFVFPTYAWAPPKIILDFISNLTFINYKNNYIFGVATCDANIGNAMDVLKTSLDSKHYKLDSGFSIIMPNNYVIATKVNSQDEVENKLKNADNSIKEIAKYIENRTSDVYLIVRGSFPTITTKIINPLFIKYGCNPSKFFATDECISCKICEKVCPCNNISVTSTPTWGNNCIQCLACINYCPAKAIEYGKGSKDKGRYTNPNIKIEEMFLR